MGVGETGSSFVNPTEHACAVGREKPLNFFKGELPRSLGRILRWCRPYDLRSTAEEIKGKQQM